MVRITFHGAAETVTGSKYLIEADDAKVLIDCGLFQGVKDLRLRNWATPAFAAKDLDAVVLTHAHLDHTGYLPRLVRQGLRGPVYCTRATGELSELLLLDSAKLQEEDAAYANRKGYSKHRPALPLYEASDVKRTMKLFRTVARDDWTQAAGPIWFRYHDTGHLLGSCMIELEIRAGARPTRVLFSGDVGRYDAPLYYDPAPPPECDFLICESTYGDRNHPQFDPLDQLELAVNDAVRRGGVIVVASFAVGRAQQLMYLLSVLTRQGRIPAMPIYLDSPMAVSGTNIYRFYAEEHDLIEGLAVAPDFSLDFSHVTLSRTAAESQRINSERGPAVIIASSGMMTAGRILHHLRQRLPDERNTIVLSGFQAYGTRGQQLRDGARSLRIHGRDVPARAAVVQINALSGHADRAELLRWLSPLPAPKQVFLTHGEISAATALAETLRADRGWNVTIPHMGESFELSR